MGSTALTDFLKLKYPNDKLPEMLLKEFPLLDAIPKRTDGSGYTWQRAVKIGDPQGVGPTRAIAQEIGALAGTLADTKGKQWTMSFGKDKASVYIDNDDMERASSVSDAGAFIDWLGDQIDGIQRSALTRYSILLYADQGKSLGTFTESTGVCTFANQTDVQKIPIGAVLVASANAGNSTSDALIGSPSKGYVFARDEQAGTVTVATSEANAVAGTAGTPSSWTSTMYAFFHGEFGGTSTPNAIFQGLGAWIPPTAPGATAFNGVVRTSDISRLSGYRLSSSDLAGYTPSGKIKHLVMTVQARGTTPGITHVTLNPEYWQQVADELEGKHVFSGQGGIEQYDIGTHSIRVAINGSWLELLADRHCPIKKTWALTMPKDGSNIVMRSIGELWHPLTKNGDYIWSATADVMEHRLVSAPSLCVAAPGWCGYADLS